MKRLLSLLIVMLAITIPNKLWAQEPYAVLSDNNTVLTFYYDDQKEARNGMSVGPFSDEANSAWYAQRESITSAVFDPSFANCTTITSTAWWFSYCTNLTSITGLNYLNTANVTNMKAMFLYCMNLTNLDVSGFKTDNVTDMCGMFYECESLSSLDVSGFKTDNVTDMSGMFEECLNLTNLDVSGFKTDNVTNISHMFDRCRSLTSLDLSGFNTQNVTDMTQMFLGCRSLTSLDVSGFKTDKVTNMSYMFDHCRSLTSLDVSSFNTQNVTDMSSMFKDCSSLTSLDLSSFNTSKVVYDKDNYNFGIQLMFENCSKLMTIYVSDGWTTANLTESADVFKDCVNLIGGKGTKYDADHVDYTYAHIDGGENNPGYFTDKNAPQGDEIIQFVDPITKSLCVTNWDTNGDGELSMTEAAAVQSIGKVFTASTISSFDELRFFVNVSSLERNAFYLCDSLKTITLPESLHSLGAFSFAKSPLLTTVDIPQTVVSIGESAFEGCIGLTSIVLPDSLSELGGWALGDCTGLTSIVIPKKITSLSRRLLYRNTGLTSVTLPETLISIGESAMEGCINLVEIVIPQSVTEIGPNAFSASGLTTVTIPSGVTNIGQGAFNGEPIQTVTSEIENPFEIDGSTFAENVYQNATLFVPVGKVDAYRSTPAWNQFLKIREIGSSANPEPYAVLSDNNTVLTFYYDGNKANRNGLDINYTNSWDDQRKNITKAVFDDSFANCLTLTSVNWFRGCSKLTTIIGIENLKTDNVTDMSGMFYDCSSLTSLDVSHFKTDNVTTMGVMFMGCSSLSSLDVSHFNTEKMTNMNAMFYGCSDLSSLDLSSFKTDNVTDMSAMFVGCSSLTNLNLSKFNTAKVTRMDGMFKYCSKLTSLDLSSFNTSNVTDMRNMFMFCSGLTTVYVGNDWSTIAVTYSDHMFADCTSLVGGKGTTYNPNHTDYTYAHIDGGENNPGYFTDKNAPVVVETVATPTFEFSYFGGDDLRMKTETEDAEIYYTVNGRMLQENDTDFGDGYLSGYNNRGWYVKGDNCSYSVAYDSQKDSYCLRLTSEKNDVFESARATYIFSNFLTKGDYYTIHFKARSESGNGMMRFYCYNDTVLNSRSADDTLAIGKDWADYQVTVKIENDQTNQFVLNFGAIADTYYIDNVLFGPVISDTTNQLRTPYVDPVMVQDNVTVTAVAVKQGMEDSKPAVFDYFCEGWQRLMFMYEWGWIVCDEATGDPNVPLEMVDATRQMMDDLMNHIYSRAESEYIEDSELMDHVYMMEKIVSELDHARRGFIIDGVSYHAVDSTQAEVIAPLDYYTKYKEAIEIPVTVNYNNIDFQVTSVAQGAFANSELGAIVWNPTVALKYEDVAVINNPNLLVYVNEANLAPENIQNVVVGGYAKTIVLTDVVEGNGNFYCPKEFKAEMISYTRNFQQQTEIGVSRGWETIALPFTVKTIMHEKNGVIAPFGNDASNKHFWLRTLSENGLARATQIEANTPYIISMPNSDEYSAGFNLAGLVTFSSQDAIVPVTEVHAVETSTTDGEMIVLLPNFQRVSKDTRTYALNVGEQRENYPEGSVFEANYRDIRPFEAYTIHEGGQKPAPRFIPIVDMNGEVTGIEDVRGQMSDGRGDSWYDLNGRKLQQKPKQKGVYLHNGHKVIVR